MLVFCTSCGKRISDRVAVCPFCRPAPSVPERRGRSPLVYVLAGCGTVTVLGILVTAEEQRTNPELRTARATEVLHAERLPDGYYAVFTARSPIVDVVFLGDLPARPSGEASGFHQRGFMYTRMMGRPPQAQPIRSFVAGQANNSSVLRAMGIDVATNAIIRRGTLDLEGDDIRYCAQRGDMKVKTGHAGASVRRRRDRCGRDGAEEVPLELQDVPTLAGGRAGNTSRRVAKAWQWLEVATRQVCPSAELRAHSRSRAARMSPTGMVPTP
jgi:hypothetical protein